MDFICLNHFCFPTTLIPYFFNFYEKLNNELSVDARIDKPTIFHMSKYSITTKRIVNSHDISPDLAFYLQKQGHTVCDKCQRPSNDIPFPFKNMNGKFGDYGVSKIVGCNGKCNGPPKIWTIGNGATCNNISL